MKNLDAQLNDAGYEIAKILDKSQIDKILGVLANDGVYAMFAYCESKKNINVKELLEKFTNIIDVKYSSCKDDLKKISEDLHLLLFTKEILEKILIYARYHAKSTDKVNS